MATRIIAGYLKNKKIMIEKPNKTKVEGVFQVRPTSERAREALFNILTNRVDINFNSCCFLDVCAGSGAIGFEAISRGAQHVTFIDNSPAQLEMIKYNAIALKVEDNVTLQNYDAAKLSAADRIYDVVFIDPPYANIDLLLQILSSLDNGKWIDDNTVIILEHSIRETLILPKNFEQIDQRKYGICSLVICKLSKDK